MAVVYNDYLTQAKKYYSSKRDEEKLRRNAIYDEQAKVLNDTYNAEISNAEKSYEDLYRENAVQKTINEREVAENMANMGLTDSGLNRTQQTAVQLSYANNRGNITRQKQAEVDYLARTLAAELSKVEQNRISDMATIDQTYDNYETSMANENYKSALDAETANTKAYYNFLSKQSDKDNLYHFRRMETVGNEYGTKQTYAIYDYNGKEVKVAAGRNPYINEDVTSIPAVKKYGTFDNGYQPRGVIDDEGVDHGKLTKSGKRDYIYGKNQNVWIAEDGTLWVWNGRTNEYEMYEE